MSKKKYGVPKNQNPPPPPLARVTFDEQVEGVLKMKNPPPPPSNKQPKKQIIDAMFHAQFGNPNTSTFIESYTKEYFQRWPSYKEKFTHLEWYHIFLDVLEEYDEHLKAQPEAAGQEQETQQIRVYELDFGDTNLITENKKDILNWIETDLDSIDESGLNYTITTKLMTREEIDALPDWS